jgi:hypothetical protein
MEEKSSVRSADLTAREAQVSQFDAFAAGQGGLNAGNAHLRLSEEAGSNGVEPFG